MFDFESLSNDSEGKGIGKRIIVLKNNGLQWDFGPTVLSTVAIISISALGGGIIF